MVRSRESRSGLSSSDRKLRSRGNKLQNPALFNFDNVCPLIHQNPRIRLTRASLQQASLYRNNGDVTLPDPATTSKSTNLVINSPPSDPIDASSDDPLEDTLFEGFHRKMKREEKLMTNEERLRILTEVDTLQSQLHLLNQYDWIRHLPGIAHINNTNDFNELELKNKLTIREIERLLRKHDNWKRRLDILAVDIKEFEAFQDDSDEDDEYSAPIESLRARRFTERRQKYGPLIRLKLNNGYTLIFDPLLPPKVIRSDHTNGSPGHPVPQSGEPQPAQPQPQSPPQPEVLSQPRITQHIPKPILFPRSPTLHSKDRPKSHKPQPKLTQSVLKFKPQPPAKKHKSTVKAEPMETVSDSEPDTSLLEDDDHASPRKQKARRKNNTRLENVKAMLDFQCNEEEGMIFGTYITDIKVPPHGFEFPWVKEKTKKDKNSINFPLIE